MGQPIFIFVALRGAMDGLDVVIPRGDPEFNRVRERFPFAGELPLDGFFTLHARCNVLHNLVGLGEAAFVHAVGTSYLDRSHFDGQLVLQSGGDTPRQLKTGWLNRLLSALEEQGRPARGAAVTGGSLATLGPRPFPSFGATISRLGGDRGIYAEMWRNDPKLSAAFETMQEQDQMTVRLSAPARIAELGRLGFNLFYTEFGGFDTHATQPWSLAGAIDNLDEFLGALKAAFADRWADVVLLAASEFGRGFYPNAAGGTDHGIGNAVILAGGGLKAWGLPPVTARWPGLTPEKLYQGRDLMPTKDMRAVMLAIVCRQFGLDPYRANDTIFPTVPTLLPDPDLFGEALPEELPPPPPARDLVALVKGGTGLFDPSFAFTRTVADLPPDTPVVPIENLP